jgi:adenylate cyclase
MTTVSVWPSNYHFSKKGVREVSIISRRNLMNRMASNVIGLLADVAQCLAVLNNSYRTFEKLGYDVTTLTLQQSTTIMSLFQFTPIVSAVDFGFTDSGGVMGIARAADPITAFQDDGNGTLQFYHYSFQTKQVGSPLFNISDFSIYTRPWYAEPINANRMIWQSPYESKDVPPKYIITLGAPYYSYITEQLFGIIALELDLNLIAAFTRTIPLLNATRCLLLSRDGSLIAASAGDSYTIVNGTTPVRNVGNQSTDAVVRETIEEVIIRDIPDKRFTGVIEFSYNRGKGKRVVALKEITDPHGADWIGILNVLESDVMGEIYKANRTNAIICSVCLLVSIIVAIVISCILFQPLRKVCREMDLVADMNFDSNNKIHSFALFELSEIRSSLRRMKQGLRNFQRYVPSDIVKAIVRTRDENELGVISRPISVMFADIKDFSSIAESMDPNALVILMCDFFTSMSNIIVANQGAVDKYVSIKLYDFHTSSN